MICSRNHSRNASRPISLAATPRISANCSSAVELISWPFSTRKISSAACPARLLRPQMDGFQLGRSPARQLFRPPLRIRQRSSRRYETSAVAVVARRSMTGQRERSGSAEERASLVSVGRPPAGRESAGTSIIARLDGGWRLAAGGWRRGRPTGR